MPAMPTHPATVAEIVLMAEVHRRAFVVIDDPYGYVVPSDGVKITRGRDMGKTIAIASMIHNMGMDRTLEVTRKQPDEPMYPKAERKKARKAKQHFKGLRP